MSMFERIAARFLDAADEIKERRIYYAQKFKEEAHLAMARFAYGATSIIQEEVKRALGVLDPRQSAYDDLQQKKRDFEQYEAPSVTPICGARLRLNDETAPYCRKPPGHEKKTSALDLHSDGKVSWS